MRIVGEHDPSKQPLFLYLAYQGVHAPALVPAHYADAYNKTISDRKRRTFAGMLSAVDEGIGNVTAALKAKGMLDNTPSCSPASKCRERHVSEKVHHPSRLPPSFRARALPAAMAYPQQRRRCRRAQLAHARRQA